MQINKDSAMLIDVQYIKESKKDKHPDYLYLIWKDLDKNEKYMQVIPEPKWDIYFEKPEFRNHDYNKNYQHLENCDKRTVKYKDTIFAIAEDMGELGRQKLQNCFSTGNYRGLKEFYIYPYVFGADYDIRAWYRFKWLEKFDNNRPKKLTKGFLDIEADGLETIGLPNPVFCPVDLVTLIDDSTKQSYTFALIGVECKEKDMSMMTPKEKQEEMKRREMYNHRLEQQEFISSNIDYLKEEAHKMFDESYPGYDYNFYFYKDERKMLVHLFQLINKLKLDFINIWNISFDMPYMMDRMKSLGLDPKEVMCHPDFPVKECYFAKDTKNFQVKNKSDFMHLSSYTIFTDQMINYAAIRKGQKELRSNKLNAIAHDVINDSKVDYSEDGDIKTLSYNNYLLYILYNIKDVLLQCGIEQKTYDNDTYYLTSYMNMTPYESEFKQTVKLRNAQYWFYVHDQKLVPGENVNGFLYNYTEAREDDDEDEDEEKKDEKFEGALVGNPELIGNFGVNMFGKKSNSVFKFSIDFDMSKFYPSVIDAMNVDPSTLIFKCILDSSQYDVRGGNIPYHGITDVQLVKDNNDSFKGDVAKEVFDNFQTRNYLSVAYKWLNAPSVNDIYEACLKELS